MQEYKFSFRLNEDDVQNYQLFLDGGKRPMPMRKIIFYLLITMFEVYLIGLLLDWSLQSIAISIAATPFIAVALSYPSILKEKNKIYIRKDFLNFYTLDEFNLILSFSGIRGWNGTSSMIPWSKVKHFKETEKYFYFVVSNECMRHSLNTIIIPKREFFSNIHSRAFVNALKEFNMFNVKF